MFSYVWPIALVVVSNIIYHICSKSVPKDSDPFASLTLTYLVGAAASFILFLFSSKGGNPLKESSKLNFASLVLGIAIVGLEAGFLFAYRAGWQVSTASLVQSAALSAALLFVGALLFRENITVSKLVGAAICLVGLYFINK
ncbi:MAG: EamA family transporter [Eubacteriales bacterium]|jgi:drug/metabolite transporter (DMT)-like permease